LKHVPILSNKAGLQKSQQLTGLLDRPEKATLPAGPAFLRVTAFNSALSRNLLMELFAGSSD